jgi:FlaA1/EpsC-like NDP-sugar epimerase
MKGFLLRRRRATSETIHGALAAAALPACFMLRFEFALDPPYRAMLMEALPVLLAVKLVVFRAFGLRDLGWRYLGFEDLKRMAAANAVASMLGAAALRAVIGIAFPRSIYVLDLLVCLAAMAAVRAGVRIVFDRHSAAPSGTRAAKRILIYGAGEAGKTILSEIRAHPRMGYQAAGFLDDDPEKRHLRLNGMRVLGQGSEIAALVRRHKIDEILLALPAATGAQIAAILEQCHAARVITRKIPPLAELIENQALLVDQIREVRLEDLLGRPPADLDTAEIGARLTGKVVLVTGAGGSIGAELCRQIARYRPLALIGVDHAESALYEIDLEMREKYSRVAFCPEVGNIQNRRRLDEIFRRHRPSAVYHAAAYKHVPMMESHVIEAIENNVFGTGNVARAAMDAGAETFVLVSSDKAVRPANIMGATKRMAELVCLAAAGSGARTRFLAVRFGNVLGSNGSVIPLFKRQIAAGGPVTVTHPEMRRFFMTVSEAAQLVLQTAAMGSGGEVFVLDMGQPVRIVDLARKMILLSGLKPDQDIRIEFSGVRPGEKLYEEVSAIEEGTVSTPHAQIRVFTSRGVAGDVITGGLKDLHRSVEARDAAGAVLCLKEIIPDYNPSSFVLRRAFEQRAGEQRAGDQWISAVAGAG